MGRKMWTSTLVVAIFFVYSAQGQAQQEKRFKRGMATIVFSSLGGAVLGLSTLSFYGQPEQHANNVSTGAVLGFIFGSGYVLMDSSRGSGPRQENLESSSETQSFRHFASQVPPVTPAIEVVFDF